MNNYLQNISKYFKQSLIDADLNSPEDKELLPLFSSEEKPLKKGDKYKLVDNNTWLNGRVDDELTRAIFAIKNPKNKPEITEVELMLIPRIDKFPHTGNSTTFVKRQILTPLLMFVNLTNEGELKPSDKSPWVPRVWLDPNETNNKILCHFKTVDDFFTHNPYEGIETWQELTTYCTELLCAISDNNYNESISLFDFNIHSEYKLYQQSILQIETDIQGASRNIKPVLEVLTNLKSMPPLYERFCRKTVEKPKNYQNLEHKVASTKNHLGQMTGEFPLSPNQRNSLHHFFEMQEGEILAINGPPGTGKTTLLRSVVANMWVRAALKKSEPPIIVASSNNNQAATNILDSFAMVDEVGIENELKGRWLPNVKSYGLYCCSSNKADETDYMFYNTGKSGCMEDFQDSEYLENAKKVFLDKTSQWHHDDIDTIKEAEKLLQTTLRKTERLIVDGIDFLVDFQKIDKEIKVRFGSFDKLRHEIDIIPSQQKQLNTQANETNRQFDDLCLIWGKRSIFIQLLLWVPSIIKTRASKN